MWSLFNGETANPVFQSEPGLQVLKLNGKTLLISPDLGGWAVVSQAELIELLNPTGFLSPQVGEKAYQHGLARKNGHSVFDSSAQTDQLFFFEFDVSDECNLACLYCSSNTKPVTKIARLSPQQGTKWIDRVLEYCLEHPVRKIQLEFTGGEPLANVEFLAETTKYAMEETRKHGIEATFLIVSNLTIVGPRQIEFLKGFPIGLNVSLDGDQPAHDSQRRFTTGKGSFDVIMRNFERLKQAGISVSAIQSTITARTVDRLPEIAQFLMDLGYCQLSLHYMSLGGARQGCTPLKADPETYVNQLFEVFETKFLPVWRKTGLMPHTRTLALAYAYLLEPKRTYMCQRSPCGAGREIIAVKANGDVYGCANGPFVKEFVYGNIWQDSFEQCQQSRNASASAARHFRDLPGCSTCLFRGWCQGGCPKDAFSSHGTIQARSGNCAMYQALWKRSLGSLVEQRYPHEAVHALAASYLR
jgi:uncharacterized protein